MSFPERFDTIVIGAGMSGLAAGIRLAQFDQRVVVLDKHSLWGGLNSFYKLGGHKFDVGLHALTNFVPPRTKGRPLTRILRQLRLSYADLQLGQQNHSQVVFPGARLRFGNGLDLIREEIAAHFPGQRAGFERLVADLEGYPEVSAHDESASRERLAAYFDEPLFVEMLLLPLLYYGSPTPHDIAWSSFVILFKSLYEEGFARPAGGVRTILDLLRNRYAELGGELRMRSGVRSIRRKSDALHVTLEDGTLLLAEHILSSAGYVETMRLAGQSTRIEPRELESRLTFLESISVLDRPSAELGYDTTITFFNTESKAVYAPPPGAVDYRSGVVCCPDNYQAPGNAEEPALRLTLLASYGVWADLPEAEYQARKQSVWQEAHGRITHFAPDVRPHTTFTDVFTPTTIEHYTGHVRGSVYGCPIKRPDGTTAVPGLYLCGTDQGYLGIVGAMLSGIAMANSHVLARA